MTLVKVVWLDSAACGGDWHPDEARYELAVCETVGFIHESDEAKLVLLQSRGIDRHMNVTTIPRGCVVSIKTLEIEADE